MTHHAVALAVDVDHLTRPGGILDTLEALLPEPVADPTLGTTSHHKVTGSPAPWHVEAAAALMDIHAGARELETDLKYRLTGRLPDDRGCSDANTRAALKSIVRLVEGLDDTLVKATARTVSRWVTAARQIRDLDDAERWEPLPRLPGHLPPACDYCGTYSLRWARRSATVRCCNTACVDEDGHRPQAVMEVGKFTGQAMLVWADGRSVTYRVEEPAA